MKVKSTFIFGTSLTHLLEQDSVSEGIMQSSKCVRRICAKIYSVSTRHQSAQAAAAIKPFYFQDILESEKPLDTPWKKLTGDYVSTFDVMGKKVLKVEPQALTLLAEQAMIDIAHLLRPGHLQQLSNILKDPESSENDKFVALELLKNANIASAMVLPGCQDTGTAICMGKKGQYVWTEGNDAAALSKGVYNTYTQKNLRYSQTKALLNPEKLLKFVDEKAKTLGTAACPPYHLAVVIGGTSAEFNLKTVKLASAKYLDNLPCEGNEHGRGFRDRKLEEEIHKLTQRAGIGAQFGGKYFCHDVRVIRLPRHGASCPVGIGVSCSADRQALGKITEDGVFLEQLETNVSKYLPEVESKDLSSEVVQVSCSSKYLPEVESKDLSSEVVQVNLNQPMAEVLKVLSNYPIRTRVSLNGTLVVARDIAHAKLQERIDNGEGLPEYVKNHPIYYAGPAKTPVGFASGSFGPTTAGRMDSYVEQFQKNGGSMIMLAKGNRSKQVTKASAILAQNCIKKVEVLEYPELGMEAIWKVEVENFPAFIVVDNKGNDFFKEWQVE
ncbi:E4.2.1.2A [Mytilus edulis]|uniref:fumarate hydratase n=1 Tax=Mytilus edulis TaxID=6550 RepID=A0A8S3SQP5_MYTED|nr:E4.2.1.2A [Mytilus edulis]